jgi:type IV pilus assembly protein PilM
MTLAVLENRPTRFGRRASTAIGLDLGSTAVRAFEISYRSSGPVVEAFGSVPVSPGAVRGGLVEDPKAVSAAVKELWSQQKFRSRRVVLGLTHAQVIVRDLTVPAIDGKDLRKALPYLVRDVLPFPADQALLDFHAIGPAADGSGGTDGLVVAAPKDAVVKAVDAVQKAGLFVETVDLASFAAMRATATTASAAEVVVDIGAYATNLVLHVGGIPRMVRCVPRGGAEITALVALRHDLSIDEAEVRKCRVGLVASPDGADDPEVAATVGEALRPLFREIRSSVSWFTTHHPDQPVATISLCGGGSLLPGLVDTIRRRLDVPTRVADPLSHMMRTHRDDQRLAELDRLAATAAVSIGLTLGAAS